MQPVAPEKEGWRRVGGNTVVGLSRIRVRRTVILIRGVWIAIARAVAADLLLACILATVYARSYILRV